MAQAFGVEQELQVSGFSANPNNTGVTRPRGINPSSIGAAGEGIAKGITEFVDSENEANIVKSIANARDKMRAMEAAGKTPVEISTFRDEAASAILNRFPTSEAVNLINSGLRQSRASKLSVRADGTIISEDEDGNPLSVITSENPDLALQASLMNKAVTIEGDLPSYSEAAGNFARKAGEAGSNIGGLIVGNTAVVSRAIGTLNEEQGTLQLQISRLGVEQAEAARTRARNNVMGAISAGLLELGDAEMMAVLSDTGSVITPSDVVQLGQAYVADWFQLMNEEGAFSLFDIDPFEFKTKLQEIVDQMGQTAQAAFTNNNTLLERRVNETQLVRNIYENEVFNNLARTQPNVHRLLVSAEGIKNAGEVLLQVREIEALYPTSRPATQELSLDVLTALIGRTPAMEAAAIQGPRIKEFASDERQVESFMQWANMMVDDPNPASMLALKRAYNDGEGFRGMEVAMEEAGRGDEWKKWFRQFEGYVKRLEAIEQNSGKTFEQSYEDIAPIRREATDDKVDSFIQELLEFETRERDEVTEETRPDGGTSD